MIEKELERDSKPDPNELRETKELLVELAAMEGADPVKFRRITALHHDMTEELAEDSALTVKLAANFEENRRKLAATLTSFRERLSKLKKK
ncbi:unnamed protein product [Sphagnum balticum]